MKNYLLLLCVLFVRNEVKGHGRLMDPPARNAMWRFGFPTPENYNDNEVFCGGFAVQHLKNNGRCGVCGDDYREKQPRKHEAGGLYGHGINVREYFTGQVVEIKVDITSNHKGVMTIELCSHNNPKRIAKHKCFEYLQVVGGPDHKFVIPPESNRSQAFTWKVQLPPSLRCSQCILRWTYKAGNNWGKCDDGSEGLGCGNQETFINCADVEIYDRNIGNNDIEGLRLVKSLFANDDAENGFEPLMPYEFKPLMTYEFEPLMTPQTCLPIGENANMTGMGDSCRHNCLKYPPSNCDPHDCKCVRDCKAVGVFALKKGADIYCTQNCLRHPSVCPKDRCECF